MAVRGPEALLGANMVVAVVGGGGRGKNPPGGSKRGAVGKMGPGGMIGAWHGRGRGWGVRWGGGPREGRPVGAAGAILHPRTLKGNQGKRKGPVIPAGPPPKECQT